MLKQHMENYILKVLKLQNKNEIKDLSETIDRKFVESFNIEDYNILTDDGFKPCKAIHKTIKYDIWNLITKNYELQCADNHIVFDENYNQIFVKDLKPGDKIQTEICMMLNQQMILNIDTIQMAYCHTIQQLTLYFVYGMQHCLLTKKS